MSANASETTPSSSSRSYEELRDCKLSHSLTNGEKLDLADTILVECLEPVGITGATARGHHTFLLGHDAVECVAETLITSKFAIS